MNAPSRRRMFALAAGLALAPHRTWGAVADASPWVAAKGGAARLISRGGKGFSGFVCNVDQVPFGVELRLEPGFKTYWRTPGEAGVAPRFDWSGSENLPRTDVLFPLPIHFEEAGIGAVGYDRSVILPVHVGFPTGRAGPMRVRLKLDYATCGEICIPASATLALDLSFPPMTAHTAAIEAAMARVPLRVRTAEPTDSFGWLWGCVHPEKIPGPRAVVEGDSAIVEDTFEVATRAFLEAPEPWLFGEPTIQSLPDLRKRLVFPVLDRPTVPTPTRALLSVGDGARAEEYPVPLDPAAPAR